MKLLSAASEFVFPAPSGKITLFKKYVRVFTVR